MKNLLIFLLSAISLTAVAQQKIALLEPRVGEGSSLVSTMEKNMVRGELRKAIVNFSGFEAITRADIDQMMKEQDFQRTGMVSDSQIKRLGEMSGADYICVSTLSKSNTEFYLEAYLIHLESGRILNPASQYGELENGKLSNMFPACQALARELLVNNSNAQVKTQNRQKEVSKEEEEEVFMVVESMPEFPGGQQGLFKYLSENVKYPLIAQENGIQGRVTCRFVVNTDGSIEDVEVVRSARDALPNKEFVRSCSVDSLRAVDALDKEAVRVIQAMPKWTPGRQRGRAVRVRYTIPINFRLTSNNDSKKK